MRTVISISNRKKLAITFSAVMLLGPLYLHYVTFPESIDCYESGAPIGVEIDLIDSTPLAEIIINQETESGEFVLTKGHLVLKQIQTFTPETLPPGYDFHLALTEKHLNCVEFRTFVDVILGTSGNAVPIFETMQFYVPLIGGLVSLYQSILTVLRDDKKRGFWFYEFTYILIMQNRNKIIKSKLTTFKIEY